MNDHKPGASEISSSIPWRHRLLTRTLVFLMLPAAILLPLSCGSVIYYVGLEARENAESTLRLSITEASRNVELYLRQFEEGVRFIVSHFDHHGDYQAEGNVVLLSAFTSTHKDIHAVWVVSPKGETALLFSRQDMMSDTRDQHLLLPDSLSPIDSIRWHSVRFNEFGDPLIACSVALRHPWENHAHGHLIFQIRSNDLNRIASSLDVGKSGIAFLADREGRLISHSDRSVVVSKQNVSSHPALRHLEEYGPASDEPLVFGVSGSMMAVRAIASNGWKIVVTKKESEVFQTRNRLMWMVAGAFFILLLVSVPFIVAFSIRTTRPITALLNAIDKFSQGRLDDNGTVTDLSELGLLAKSFHQMARQRLLSEQRYRELVDWTDNLITSIDGDGRFVFVNHVGGRIFGLPVEEVVGKSAFDFVHPDDRMHTLRWFRECVKTRATHSSIENRQVSPDGEQVNHLLWNSHFFYDDHGHCTRMDGIAHNITERKRAEEERQEVEHRLLQSQKMEAIGTLAGGIAHDFNNILTPIIGHADLSLNMGILSDAHMESFKEIRKAAVRARHLVKQILMFGRRDEQVRIPLAPHPIIKETVKFLRSSIPTTIEIRTDIPADCGSVLGDPTQLQQIVMNLCTNAYYAMRERGGVLGVSLKKITVDESDAKVLAENMTAGSYLEIEISDSGSGIDKGIIDKIFEPYFTTKDKGEGTGLGLATVHGIVKAYGGHISVYSEPGHGTTFHVYLPRVDVLEEEEQTIPDHGAMPTGTERVLLVDDEEIITGVQNSMLSKLGYEVLVCNGSREALSVFEEKPDRIDLVITDMTMPELTGLEMSRKILEVRPEMPIILCTGFSDLINKDKAFAVGIREFFMKPVSMNELAVAVRRLLDQTGRAGDGT